MTTFAAELKERLQPLRAGDLDTLLDAIALLFQPVEDRARDTDNGDPGWSKILDLARVNASELPWLAQFVGANYPRKQGETDAAFLARVAPLVLAKTRFQRGTIAATIADVKETLTGTKQVFFIERQGGSAWRTTITTLTAETPSAADTLAAIMKHKPIGIVLTHSVITGGNWSTVNATHTNWNDLNTPATTWDAVAVNPSA